MAQLAIAAAASWGASAGAAAMGYAASATFMGMTAGQIGWMVGSYIGGQMLAEDTYGPRIEDLRIQVSTYGVPVPVVYGTMRTGGNVIWSTDLIEHANSESAKGGPEYTTYSYTVSCAVAMCAGEISGVQKIWANNELIYDVTVDNDGPTGFSYDIKIYTGSETQEPDPTMQAALGVADTPAHRGMAYVVFTDFALEKFGNRIPQFNFQVVADGDEVRPDVTQLSTLDGDSPLYDPQTGRVVRVNYAELMSFYDYASGTELYSFTVPNFSYEVSSQIVSGPVGTFFLIDPNGYVQQFSFSSMSLIDTVTTDCGWRSYAAWSNYDNRLIMAANNLSTRITVYDKSTDVWVGTSIQTVSSAYNTWGGIVVIPAFGTFALNAGLQAGWVVLYNGDKICVLDNQYSVRLNYQCATADIYTDYSGNNNRITYDNKRHSVYITNASKSILYVLDMETLSVTRHGVYVGANILYHVQTDLLLGIGTGGTPSFRIFDPDDLPTVLDSFNIDVSVNAPDSFIQGQLVEIDGLMDAVLVAGLGPSIADGLFKIPFGTRLTSRPVPLSDIVEDQCIRAGLTAGDVNVTALTDEVDGYIVAQQSSARSNIEPLQVAYFFDATESDDVLKFVKRGGSSAVTIPEDDIGAYEYGTDKPDLLENVRTHETELPRQIAVNYLNIDAEYQQGSQYDRRLTGDANIETTMTLPLALDDDKARQIAAVNLYSAWANRNLVKFATGIKYTRYEPTDIFTIQKGNTERTVRITKKDEGGNGLVMWEGATEDAAAYTQTVEGAAALSMPTQTITLPVSTRLELMDIALLRDVDDGAGFYWATAGYRTGWQGAELFRSADDGVSWAPIDAITNESPIGNATTALGDFVNKHSAFDELNSVTVRLANSGLTLSSTTEINVLAGVNAALLGDELINYRTATLNVDGSYTLTGLLRGRRGTEWAMSTHAIGDRFVALSYTNTRRTAADSAELDLERLYRPVSFGTTLAQTLEYEFTNTGAGLKPYAPCHLGGGRDASGNITLKWVRRTRIGGEWRDYVDATQPEASLSYEVEIWDSSYSTLKRTISSITSETTSYSSANQTTDFGSTQSTIYVRVYQLSATVGRGYKLEGTV